MSRTNVYIDGFNLYFGLRDARLKRFFWLDVVALSQSMLKPDQTLEHVHYFTARLHHTGGNAADLKRQNTYLDALDTLNPLTIHEGRYLAKYVTCKNCGNRRKTYEEKETDVNIAIQLVLDANDDNFDTAILLSGDSDLTTPVRQVRARFPHKRVVIAFPPRRNSEALKNLAVAHFNVGHDKIRRSQLPDPIYTASGVKLERPVTWR